jgi:ketosteroid isomerase-like protein
MLTDLPPLVAEFFEASEAQDLDRFVACFAADAVVEDEGKTHNGTAAIQEWKRQSQNSYTYTAEPSDLVERDGKTILIAHADRRLPRQPRRLDLRAQNR